MAQLRQKTLPYSPLIDSVSSEPNSHLAASLAPFLAALDQRTREVAIEQWSELQGKNLTATSVGDNDLLTVEKTAELLDVVPQTIFDWRKRNILIAYKIGNRVYFKRSEVIAALKVQSMPDGRRKYARRQYEKKAR